VTRGSKRRSDETPLRLKRRLTAEEESAWALRRAEMLLDLANLPDESCERFRQRYEIRPSAAPDTKSGQRTVLCTGWFELPSDNAALLSYRDELRKLWAARASRNAVDEAAVLSGWMSQAHREAARGSTQLLVIGAFAGGLYGVGFNDFIFPLSLAHGATELEWRMGVCGNPDCPDPYFLKGRKGQRFCDRKACASYGQREHKRKWWNEHRARWKAGRLRGEPAKTRAGEHAKAT
jgi:hypothetical protein